MDYYFSFNDLIQKKKGVQRSIVLYNYIPTAPARDGGYVIFRAFETEVNKSSDTKSNNTWEDWWEAMVEGRRREQTQLQLAQEDTKDQAMGGSKNKTREEREER
jgi:hypothetical protein